MNGYSSVFWFSLCASLSALGLVLTVMLGRRRSARSMLHGAAWSLIPIAAYMTGSTLMFWRIGEAIGKFASSFVFLPLRWAGIGVAGLIVAAFLAGGSRARRKAARGARAARRTERAARREAAAGGGKPSVTSGATGVLGTAGPGTVSATPRAGAPATRDPEPARRAKAGGKPAGNDDMADIEEILRRRGILPVRRECAGSRLASKRRRYDCAVVSSCAQIGSAKENFLFRDGPTQITFGSRLPKARSVWFQNHR